ncbi:ras-related protein Rab-33B-like [Denticeps clupeoides]|uniref:ras-related protein Rab-33B-like n=1 Tax=Denticeps clupeoides TaxID=299321 RepID=UPI0010A43208|nr:ras-related protein Rab-33B-like [Denticeps clupeoides]
MESSLEVSTSVQGAPEQLGSRTFKVVVIGDSGVGKTCLTYRFCTGCFHDKPEATIGVDFRERILEVEGERIKVQLWDTAGQERFRKSMVQQYYRSVHAVVLVYDVSNPSSFRSLPLWLEECRRNVPGQDVPRVLVGNKSDLVAAGKVSSEQAQKFAEAHGMPFYQTSAKGLGAHSDTVEAIMCMLAHRLKKQQPLLNNNAPCCASFGSFKLKAKSRAEKEKWTCNC